MGSMTYLQLRTEAGLLARDDSRDALLKTKYVRWLRQEAAAWPWPVVQRRFQAISLPAGTQRLLFGNGVGSATDELGNVGAPPEILEIKKPVFVYTSTYGSQARANITDLGAPELWLDESSLDPTRNTGLPASFKVRRHPTLEGEWILYPAPVPDQAYLIAFDARVIPTPPSADGDLSWYPNDETSVAAMRAYLNDLNDGIDSPTVQAALALVASKVKDDRQRWGAVDGTNRVSMLDPGVFL